MKSRILETSTTTGTGNITLLGAIGGFRTFASVITSNGWKFPYVIAGGTEWEVGTGTRLSSTSFSRLPSESSNGGALVSFAAGTKEAWIDWTPQHLEQRTGINVVDYGADPTGVNDSAPAFRAVMGSNRVILVPPGTYLLSSFTTPVFNPVGTVCVDIDSFSNFVIRGYGATINTNATTANCPFFLFTRCTNFQVLGFKLNHTIPAGGFSPGIGFISDVDVRIADITFGPTLQNQAFFADYLVNARFENIHIRSGINTFDFAYVRNVSLDRVVAEGTSGVFFQCLTDTVNVGLNSTGYTITDTEFVSINRCEASGGYGACVLLGAGKHHRLTNNYWHDLPGSGIAPTAIQLNYFTAAAISSVGVPVTGVLINGDVIANLGSGVPGTGIYIEASAISNSDKISDVTITNVSFYNVNFNGIGMTAGSVTHVSDFILGPGVSFGGTGTSLTIDSVFNSVAKFLTSNNFGLQQTSSGSQTQSTNKGTTVTLNKRSGDITMNNAALAAGTIVSFTLSNNQIGPGENLILTHISGGTQGAYTLTATPAGGGAVIFVRNNTGGSLSEAIVIRFTGVANG